jgi:uncharacterized membrane protein YhaH (DUF805 family)
MDLKTLLFSFSGRINRAKYWLAMLVSLIAIAIAVIVVVTFRALLGESAGWAIMVIAVIATAVFCAWISLATAIKRLHDREKSGWWIVLFYFVPGFLDRISSGMPDTAGLILSVIGAAISIWGLVELGFLKGTTGSNSYGPDPIPVAVTT